MRENKDHLLIKALNKEEVSRPPVWLMRQAGRYLPEYMVLREKYDFFTRVETPELACEITMQPIDIIGPDAAIIFSDILVIPKAMGMEVQLVPKKGPYIPNTIQGIKDIDALIVTDMEERLNYMFDALSLTKNTLNGRVPLIGFAGAPWTLMCYMIEGQGSKTFSEAKAFLYKQPKEATLLLDKLTDYIIGFLKLQHQAGADVVQLFDSWSGLLSPTDFNHWILPRTKRIVSEVSQFCPVICFAKGSWYALEEMSTMNCALGLDWTTQPTWARQHTGDAVLQGNMDPSQLLAPRKSIEKQVKSMVNEFGIKNYIANLGHGLMPNIPVDHVRTFVDTIKNYA